MSPGVASPTSPNSAPTRDDGNGRKRTAPPSTRAAYPRKRAVTACMVCRGRRTKCDNKKPKCSFCERVGAECVSEANDFSGFDPASLEIITRLERIERALEHNPDDAATTISFRDQLGSYSAPSQVSAIQEAPLQSANHVRAGDADALLPQNLQKIIQWPVFAPFLASASTMEQIPSPLTATSMAPIPGSTASSTPFGLDLDLKHCLSLVDSFMAYVHLKNPIFDEEPLRVLVKQACFDGFGWDAQSCLALLVCATGAASMPFERHARNCAAVNDDVANALFHAAQKRLGVALDSGGLIQAQAFFLAGQFHMCKLRAYDAWRMFLQAVAACQGFVCVTKLTFPRTTTPGDSSLEERIYWSSWKSESELRWELGLRDFGSPVIEYPSLFPTLPEGWSNSHLHSWYFYLSEISLWRLHTAASNEIQTLAAPSHQPFLQALAAINPALEDKVLSWQNSLAPPVYLHSLENAAGETNITRYVLRGHVSNYYELITWPFVTCCILNPAALQGSHAVTLAAKGLEWHSNRLLINSPGFFHRHHGTWLMQRSSSRSAMVLLAAALTPEAASLLPAGWEERVHGAIGMLRYWQGDAPDAENYANLLESLMAKYTETRPGTSAGVPR